MNTRVKGIHHITAISGAAPENFRFYTQTLGLRLVKKTVNFDDPSVYHLYYGDETGAPGTLMTFFPYGGPPGRQGSGQVVTSSYPVRDLSAWKVRLEEGKVALKSEERLGQQFLSFQDPHGMGLELYESEQADDSLARITGATLKVQALGPTLELLEFLGFERLAQEGPYTRMSLPGAEDFVDVFQSREPRGNGGAGTVHHIALRVADDQEQATWLKRLREKGLQVSPVIDRNYFHSIYFREPGGVLFELATDPPGMLIDETVEDLGRSLVLPAQYEKHRRQIEEALPPLPSLSKTSR